MEGYDEATYGDRVADVYDDWFDQIGDLEACVERLESLARGALATRTSDSPPPEAPCVLELGVGTGRIALPLAARGLDVRGIDSSTAMLDVLGTKAGAGSIAVAVGDMAAATVPRRDSDPADAAPDVDLAFVAFNTFFNLTGTLAQQQCLASVASILAPGGRFLVDAFVPDLVATGGNRVTVRTLAADRLVLVAAVLDESDQTIAGQYVDITENGIRLRPWLVHYLTPEQLDAMAGAAGLTLEHRWSDYAGTPFDPAHSAAHVSVYRRARSKAVSRDTSRSPA